MALQRRSTQGRCFSLDGWPIAQRVWHPPLGCGPNFNVNEKGQCWTSRPTWARMGKAIDPAMIGPRSFTRSGLEPAVALVRFPDNACRTASVSLNGCL